MFLGNREPELIEEMDRENCDLNKLHNTYRQFHYINKLISKWRTLYVKEIRPVLEKQGEATLLDIGFGGGDITTSIGLWAQKDGLNLKITAVDPDERAFTYCRENHSNPNIEWLKCTSSDLVEKNLEYDIVISNHVIHHLSDEEVLTLLDESEKLSTGKVIFNDIERNFLGYLLFYVFSRVLFHNSFITEDGLTSIRRSFKRSELKKLIPHNWKVKRSFPFRLFLIHEK
jgi:2-polyprenyl-3-methyl-5-hydroxy-6-metoxy-1,4-benzoquinol methylase